MLIAARLFGQAAMRFLPIAAQCDDHQVRAFGLPPHPTSQFEAVHIRQADIEKDDVRLEGAQHLKRDRSVRRNADSVTVARENHFQRLGDIVVILDHKDTPDRLGRLGSLALQHVTHRRRRFDRQPNRKFTALAGSFAGRFDRTAMQIRQSSYQRQSKAETSCGGRCRFIQLLIEVEDAFEPILRDSNSVIANSDVDVMAGALRRNRDFAAFKCVLRCIVQEVRQ